VAKEAKSGANSWDWGHACLRHLQTRFDRTIDMYDIMELLPKYKVTIVLYLTCVS
jgi:hypothetical protein